MKKTQNFCENQDDIPIDINSNQTFQNLIEKTQKQRKENEMFDNSKYIIKNNEENLQFKFKSEEKKKSSNLINNENLKKETSEIKSHKTFYDTINSIKDSSKYSETSKNNSIRQSLIKKLVFDKKDDILQVK